MIKEDEKLFKSNGKSTRKLHSDAEMRYLIYDLGHDTETLLNYLIQYDNVNEVALYLRRMHKIKQSTVKPEKIRQHFRMYKLWGLNAAEVQNMLNNPMLSLKNKKAKYVDKKGSTVWRNIEFEAGSYPRKSLYTDKQFVENATTFGMDAFDYASLTKIACHERIKHEEVLQYLENCGFELEILNIMDGNYNKPLPYKICELVGREYHNGWVEGMNEEF